MPDIDIDFDDEGRGKVIDYVIKKYGSNQVAQIITYGTMAAKSSIRDTARVLDLPLFEADRIAKLIPGMKLSKIFSLDEKELKEKLRSEEIELVNELKKLSEGSDLSAETINKARVLEGSVRNTGIHACGVIITPSDINQLRSGYSRQRFRHVCNAIRQLGCRECWLVKNGFLRIKNINPHKAYCKNCKSKTRN